MGQFHNISVIDIINDMQRNVYVVELIVRETHLLNNCKMNHCFLCFSMHVLISFQKIYVLFSVADFDYYVKNIVKNNCKSERI